jgi:hypothetical protein
VRRRRCQGALFFSRQHSIHPSRGRLHDFLVD